ncbi:MAG: hypothetical protein IPM94_14030 [bacterium]|nr:hypothetical protein [bacterium]
MATLPTGPYLSALRCEAHERTPIWIMRAGRPLPARYRAVREKTSFIGLSRRPSWPAR